jgi:hypothetical protein
LEGRWAALAGRAIASGALDYSEITRNKPVTLLKEYMVFKTYEHEIRQDIVQADIDVAHVLMSAMNAQATIFALGGDGRGMMDTVLSIKEKLPFTAQLKKHTIAPWLMPMPSLEKDGEDAKGMVDYYQRVNANVELIKERRRKERERVAAMSEEERKAYELERTLEANAYKVM